MTLALAVQAAIVSSHALNPLGLQSLDKYGENVEGTYAYLIAQRVLIAARTGNILSVEAICATAYPCGHGTASDKILRQPGALVRLVTILTMTHNSGNTDGTVYPGFLFAGLTAIDISDLRVFNITSVDQYHGIGLSIDCPFPVERPRCFLTGFDYTGH